MSSCVTVDGKRKSDLKKLSFSTCRKFHFETGLTELSKVYTVSVVVRCLYIGAHCPKYRISGSGDNEEAQHSKPRDLEQVCNYHKLVPKNDCRNFAKCETILFLQLHMRSGHQREPSILYKRIAAFLL